jgi:adenosine 3'-phospho 5'-phosphosulfate transporter B2
MNRQHEVVPHQSTHEQSLEEGKPDAKRSGENKYTKSGFTRYAKLVFCFLGLQVSYVLWGLVQEYLMTKEYAGGKFKSSSFCVFGNRILALLISLGIVMFRKATATAPMKEAPFYAYAPSSLSNTLSSWAQYEALKFLSFPTQTLSKSCKIIPVMLVRQVEVTSCSHQLTTSRCFTA